MKEGDYYIILPTGQKLKAAFTLKKEEDGLLEDVIGYMRYKLKGIDMKATIYSNPKKNRITWEMI